MTFTSEAERLKLKCFKRKWTSINNKGPYKEFCCVLQSVPLATEPGISLIILPLMRLLQRKLKRTYLIV